jgi:hypothetical protein
VHDLHVLVERKRDRRAAGARIKRGCSAAWASAVRDERMPGRRRQRLPRQVSECQPELTLRNRTMSDSPYAVEMHDIVISSWGAGERSGSISR